MSDEQLDLGRLQGMVLAAGMIARSCPVEAEEILKAGGVFAGDDLDGCAAFDIKQLIEARIEMPGLHAAWQKARREENAEQSEKSLKRLSPRARGLLADLMEPMRSKDGQVYNLPSCTRHWYLAHQAFPGMRGRCELTVDQMIVLNCSVRDALGYLGITSEWIRDRLTERSPSDVADPRVDQE
ncbi:hypothetical protein [Halomonas colorata]|uniref:hypothetical protein n=1 Tax=Halomonas colorata TaxID=2742615 RepID=UPI001868707F|nr:hypothetical protein [Halomonas colorata]